MHQNNHRLLQLASHHTQILPLSMACCWALKRLDPEVRESVLYAVLVLMHKLSCSDVCVRLSAASFDSVVQQWRSEDAQENGLYSYVQEQFADFAKVREEIISCTSLIGRDEHSQLPLILWQERLYLRRYFLYESRAAEFILRSEREVLSFDEEELGKIRQGANLLFGEEDSQLPNYQKIAALTALRNRFTVITGGPGTGKTTTVTKVLLLLLALSGEQLEIRLCAPTGKAAENMTKSIALSRNGAEFTGWVTGLAAIFGHQPQVECIPESAQTLHSLLQVIPHRSTARVNAHHQLSCQVLVVDEVSMVDLPLFAKLCEGLSPRTRLILLGDKDQLFSVESGSLLSDLCSALKPPSPEMLSYLGTLTGHQQEDFAAGALSDTTAFLTKSHRFRSDSGIGILAAAVNCRGESVEQKQASVRQCFARGFADLKLDLQSDELHGQELKVLARRIAAQSVAEPHRFSNLFSYKAFLEELKLSLQHGLTLTEAQKLFDSLNQYRILCSNRQGALGQDELNELISEEVRRSLNLNVRQPWFPGRVILITRNNQALKLANGDVGYVGYLKDGGHKELMVFFKGHGAEARAVRPVFLNDYEDGYVMTVHKSQGSEYDEVLLVLSHYDNPVLTRELVYTGITRARQRLCLNCSEAILTVACSRSVQRESGLPLRLGAPA